jgi:hypothetical protein
MNMNKKLHELAKSPIFFERNRVFRVYKGGALLTGFSMILQTTGITLKNGSLLQ